MKHAWTGDTAKTRQCRHCHTSDPLAPDDCPGPSPFMAKLAELVKEARPCPKPYAKP